MRLSRLTKTDVAIIGGVFVIGLALRLYATLAGAGLTSYGLYDDGVYFASAIAFVHGFMPYRDFGILHTPGIVLIGAPFAALGGVLGDSVGFGLIRLLFLIIGAVNAGLVALLALRFGRLAALLAGLLMAIWYGARFADHTLFLIPPQTLLLLIALLLVASDRRPGLWRMAIAGACMGASTSVQIWNGLPLVVLLGGIIWSDWRAGQPWRARAGAYVAGAVAAGAIICLPFFLAAPREMVEMTIFDQLGRPASGKTLVARLALLEGWPKGGVGSVPDWVAAGLAPIITAGIAATAWFVPRTRVWAVMLLFEVAFILKAPVQFMHYTGWVAPLMTVMLGIGMARGIEAVRSRPMALRAAAMAVPVVVLVAISVVSVTHRHGTAIDKDVILGEVADARCVTADAAGLLIVLDLYRRNFANGCDWTVSTSTRSYHLDPGAIGAGRGRRNAPNYQRTMLNYYTSGQAALFIQLHADGLTKATAASIAKDLPKFMQVGKVGMVLSESASVACDPSYPTVCLPPPPPDLKCHDFFFRAFPVVAPDSQGLDPDGDGVACPKAQIGP